MQPQKYQFPDTVTGGPSTFSNMLFGNGRREDEKQFETPDRKPGMSALRRISSPESLFSPLKVPGSHKEDDNDQSKINFKIKLYIRACDN